MSPSDAFPFKDVLILSQYYAPEPGAPQIRLGAMARELKRLGVNVRVITGMPNYPVGRIQDAYRGKLTMAETVDGIPVRRVWLYPAAGKAPLKRLLNYFSFTATAALALLFSRRADLIFVEAQPIILAVPAWVLKKLTKIPYIYNTPDIQVEHAAEAKWTGPFLFLIRAATKLEAFLMKQALSVTTVTHSFIEHFIKERGVPARQMSFLPNGADTETLKPTARDENYARQMGVSGKLVFTYAGTHAHYQGLEVIIEAAERLKHRDDIVILMVGKGPVRDEMIERSKKLGLKNVLFRDSPFSEMPLLMSITHASLVVLKDSPSSLKMRLSKAVPPLACGVPVLYAGRGETAEILRREECGIPIEPERPDELASAIEKMADDPSLRETMGRRAREIAMRDFSWSFIVKDWTRQISNIHAHKDPHIPGFMI
jgi:colanic acid biosynthesis glycosyl transferase WcaI